VSKRTFFHFACAFLLLISQHGALTHSIWHLGRHLPAQAHASLDAGAQKPAPKDRSPQSRLCDLHFAMGSLLTGDCAAQAATDAVEPIRWLETAAFDGRTSQSLLTPPSRAPPVLL
jgi:hypothetical protein